MVHRSLDLGTVAIALFDRKRQFQVRRADVGFEGGATSGKSGLDRLDAGQLVRRELEVMVRYRGGMAVRADSAPNWR